MKEQPRIVWTLAASALSFALMGASNVPDLPFSKHAAMIYSAGSGDLAGYRIVVEPSGAARAVDAAGHGSGWLQPDIAQRFFSDLAAAGPLAQLSNQTCSVAPPGAGWATVEVKPSIVLTWNGQRSRSLSCAADPQIAKLLRDATAIARALYVQAYRVRPVMALGGAYGGGNASGYGQPASHGSSAYGYGNSGFANSGFSMDHFYNSGFSMDHFSNGMHFGNPYGSAPYGSSPFGGAPYGSGPYGSLPYTTLPYSASPYGSTPYGSSPFTSSPYGSGPYSSPPYSSTP